MNGEALFRGAMSPVCGQSIPGEALAERLSDPLSWARIIHLPATTSTIDEAVALIASSPPGATVIRADYQSAGRGRSGGRVWHAEPGQSLLFTLLVRRSEIGCPLALVPLATGAAVRRFLALTYTASVQIKWPNDVMVIGKKIAGILCECRDAYVMISVGLNCLQTDFPPSLSERATSLAQAFGSHVRPLEPACVLQPLLVRVREALAADGGGIVLEIEQNLYRRGALVDFRAAPSERCSRGRIAGIGPAGELLVRLEPEGVLASFVAGEIEFGTNS